MIRTASPSAGEPMSESLHTLILFTLDGQKYGVDLQIVMRVVRVVEITPVPGMPEKVMGIINFEGTIIPVINTRRIIDAPLRDLELSDQLVIVQSPERMIALVVDSVEGAIGYADAEEIPMESVIHGTKILRGILKDKEDLIFIQDIGRFLSLEEKLMLDSVLDSHGGKAGNE